MLDQSTISPGSIAQGMAAGGCRGSLGPRRLGGLTEWGVGAIRPGLPVAHSQDSGWHTHSGCEALLPMVSILCANNCLCCSRCLTSSTSVSAVGKMPPNSVPSSNMVGNGYPLVFM